MERLRHREVLGREDRDGLQSKDNNNNVDSSSADHARIKQARKTEKPGCAPDASNEKQTLYHVECGPPSQALINSTLVIISREHATWCARLTAHLCLLYQKISRKALEHCPSRLLRLLGLRPSDLHCCCCFFLHHHHRRHLLVCSWFFCRHSVPLVRFPNLH